MSILPFIAGWIFFASSVDGGAPPQRDRGPAERVYAKTRDSVVGVRAIAPLGERSGTGVILDAAGTILTSNAIVPAGSKEVRVWLPGAKRVTAEIIDTSPSLEITLLKIDPKGFNLTPIAFPDKEAVTIGDAAYTIGNAFFSIINDDQPSFSAGIISGTTAIDEERAGAAYRGAVIETTAAVNPGMEGGPLLDGEGKMIGFITPNYSPRRWLGLAIPCDVIRKETASLLAKSSGGDKQPVENAGEGFLGVTVADKDGKVVVTAVEPKSPAWNRGIREGDVILALTDRAPANAEEFNRMLAPLKAGDVVWLKIDTGGEGDVETIKLNLIKRPEKKP